MPIEAKRSHFTHTLYPCAVSLQELFIDAFVADAAARKDDDGGRTGDKRGCERPILPRDLEERALSEVGIRKLKG